MSKELETSYTPSQCLNNIRDNYFHDKDGSELEYFWFNRIETALKNYEELTSKPVILCRRTHGEEQALIDTICKNYKQVKITNLEDEKKVKAFDIIKDEFEIDFNDEKQTITFQSVEKPFTYIRFSLTREIKDNGKYNLLKEVLS